MPLAREVRRVAGRAQGLRDGHALVGQVARVAVRGVVEVQDADPDLVGVQPGHQRRARRAAAGGVVELRQPDALGREPVDVRGVDLAAEAADVGEPHVVREDQDDVRPPVTAHAVTFSAVRDGRRGLVLAQVTTERLGQEHQRHQGDRGHRHHVDRDRPRGVVVLLDQQRADDRRDRPGRQHPELVDRRHAAVADPGGVELGEQHALGPEHRAGREAPADHHGQRDERGVLGVEQREDRERADEGEGGTGDEHRPPADPVGDVRGAEDDEEADDRRDDQGVEGDGVLQRQHGDDVRHQERVVDVEGHRLADPGAHREQGHLGVAADDLEQRDAGAGVVVDELLERRRLGDAQPDEQADGDEHDAGQERDAPGPGDQGVVAEEADRLDRAGGEQQPDRARRAAASWSTSRASPAGRARRRAARRRPTRRPGRCPGTSAAARAAGERPRRSRRTTAAGPSRTSRGP